MLQGVYPQYPQYPPYQFYPNQYNPYSLSPPQPQIIMMPPYPQQAQQQNS